MSTGASARSRFAGEVRVDTGRVLRFRIRCSRSSVTRVRRKWPYWSKPLTAAVAVVDQVHQVDPALRLLDADEELGQFGGRARAGLRQFAGLADDRVGRAQRRARRLPPSPRATSARPSRRRENGVSARVALGQRGRRLAEVGEDRRGGVGEALQAAHRRAELAQEGRGTCAARLPARRRVRSWLRRRRPSWR